MLYVRLIPPGAADVAHYPRAGAAGCARAHPIHRQTELPQVLAGITRSSPMPGSPSRGRIRRCWRATTTAWSTHSPRHSRKCLRARSATAFPTCRSSRWPRPRRRCRSARPCLDAGGAQAGSRALERLGHRPAAAGRSERRGVRLPQVTEAEPEYADGWLNVARALIQEGETEAAKPYIAKALAIDPELGPHLVLQGRDPEGRRRLRWRAAIAREVARQVSARPRGAQPDRAASCS